MNKIFFSALLVCFSTLQLSAQSTKSLMTTHLEALAKGNKEAFISGFNIGMPPTLTSWVNKSMASYKTGGGNQLGNFEIQDVASVTLPGVAKIYQPVVIKTSRPVKKPLPHDVSRYKAIKAQLGSVSGYKANPNRFMVFLVKKKGGKRFIVWPSPELKGKLSQ